MKKSDYFITVIGVVLLGIGLYLMSWWEKLRIIDSCQRLPQL
ncbi:MAG: hypothetical protein ACI4GD_05915 [Lachnospiraceae bacterium]